MFQRLSPKLATHFERMRELDLIDLENRPAKRAGAYCTAFSDEAKVAILCNSVGNEGDVGTLTHEMGHAFQNWESQWIEAIDLRWPTLDACEVHSMGMEYLALPYLDEFFTPEQQARFTKSRWKRGVELLCYVSTVDAFQHWVYEHSQATPDERDAEWVRLQDAFLPGIDWSGDAERYRASRWYAQRHIFGSPFYYSTTRSPRRAHSSWACSTPRTTRRAWRPTWSSAAGAAPAACSSCSGAPGCVRPSTTPRSAT